MEFSAPSSLASEVQFEKGLLYVITMKYKMRGKKEFYKHTEKKITLRIERWYDISIILVLTMCVCMCVCVCVCFQ